MFKTSYISRNSLFVALFWIAFIGVWAGVFLGNVVLTIFAFLTMVGADFGPRLIRKD